MEWNIAAEVMSLLMLGIIVVYARKGSQLPTLKNRIFQVCLLVSFSAILVTIMSVVMIFYYRVVPIWIIWTVTTVYFILTPLMGLTYFLYTASVIYEDMGPVKAVIGVGIIPGAVYALVVLMNPFTKNIFDISLYGGYTRGAWTSLTYVVFYTYCIVSIGLMIFNRKRIGKEVCRILIAFMALAVLVIFVQQMYPKVILTGSAATGALLIIYLHLQDNQISMDYLTGLPNRQELLKMMGLILKKVPERQFTILVVSMRDFRLVNNTCGQRKGDTLLKAVSRFLQEIGPKGHVYRFNGDEFALLFLQPDAKAVTRCIERIKERMSGVWQIEDYHLFLSVVMGVIPHSNEPESLEKVVNSIEHTMAQAKSGKYGQVCFLDKAMLEAKERKRKVIQVLQSQLKEPSFEMYYQPIYSVTGGRFQCAESLMRIPHSDIGPLYPSEFIPIAEETGLIIPLTYIMLDKVCKAINRFIDAGIVIDAVHVNFSAVQFSQPDLANQVFEIIDGNQTLASAIEIEFTESTLAESPQMVTSFALKMLERGIKMGLDDFGTGYSNIAMVINIPFGTVKLDKSLVWAAMNNENSALAVKNLVLSFKALGMKVIAEGVETEAQKRMTVDFGVDQIQGHFYANPMCEDEMIEFMLMKSKNES